MRAVAIHQRNLNLIIFHSYDPIDIQEGGAEFIGYKIVILSNPKCRHHTEYFYLKHYPPGWRVYEIVVMYLHK